MAAARAFFYWPLMSLTQLLLPRKKWGRKKATTEATRTIGNRDAASQSPSSTCCVQDPFWITRSAHMLMAFWDDQQLSRKSVPYARDAWQPSFIWPSLANWVIKGFFKKAENMYAVAGHAFEKPLQSLKSFQYQNFQLSCQKFDWNVLERRSISIFNKKCISIFFFKHFLKHIFSEP